MDAAVTLAQDGKTLTMKLLSGIPSHFETGPTTPLPTSPNPPGQTENKGVTRVAVHLSRVGKGADWGGISVAENVRNNRMARRPRMAENT